MAMLHRREAGGAVEWRQVRPFRPRRVLNVQHTADVLRSILAANPDAATIEISRALLEDSFAFVSTLVVAMQKAKEREPIVTEVLPDKASPIPATRKSALP